MIIWDRFKDLEDSKLCELKRLSVTAEIILRTFGYKARDVREAY